MTGSDRHTIFVALGSKNSAVTSRIDLTPGPFEVCDGNGFDPASACDGSLVTQQNGAVFQLPCDAAVPTATGCGTTFSLSYQIRARALGTPGGSVTVTTCATDDTGTLVCSTNKPMPAVFLSAFSGESTARSLTIRNNDAKPLAITDVEHSQHLAVSVKDVEPGRVFAVTARFAPGTPVGRYEESLTLVTDRPGARRIDLPVHLWVKPDLYANPETIDFGNVRIEDSGRADVAALLTQTFFVRHRGGAFRITSIACDSAAIDVTRTPNGPSGTFQIDVRLRPQALRPGKLSGNIRVMTSDPSYPEIVIPLAGVIS